MIVESVIVGIIDGARIESHSSRRPYVVEIRRVLKTHQIVLVLEPRNEGERAADGPTPGEKSVVARGDHC